MGREAQEDAAEGGRRESKLMYSPFLIFSTRCLGIGGKLTVAYMSELEVLVPA